MQILIDTIPYDEHAAAFKWALERRGHSIDMFYVSDFPAKQGISAYFGAGTSVRISLPGDDIEPKAFDTAILRRRRGINVSPSLHPSDREFASRQATIIADSVGACFDVRGPWINSPESARNANSKLLQLKHAQGLGMRIPKTLISNCPNDVRDFCASVGGILAVKSLSTGVWTARKAGKSYSSYTSKIRQCDIDRLETSISLAPTIYQEYIEKKYEYRVVVMGASSFAARLDTQSDARTAVDWRFHHAVHGLSGISPGAVPARLEHQCQLFMAKFGLVFGSFDFIETMDGEFYFLELNQMGQFLWLEVCREFPMLSIFCDFVESRDAAFRWSGSITDNVTYQDFVKTDSFSVFFEQQSQKHLRPSVEIAFEE